MNAARPALCAAALVLLVAGTATAAAPRASCRLITDPSGDANDLTVPGTPIVKPAGLPTPSDDYLDIVSGDIASDGWDVTAAIRLTAVGIDPTSPEISDLRFTFAVGRHELELWASDLNLVEDWAFLYRDAAGNLGDATGVVDTAKKEIRITAPASAFGAGITRGTRFTHLRIRTERYVIIFPGGAWVTADSAASGRTYLVGTRSCVRPGK